MTVATPIYMQARFYDPQVGRFLSTDPVEFGGGYAFAFNRYAYANNNPYRYVDPTGMSSEENPTEPNPPPEQPKPEEQKDPIKELVRAQDAARNNPDFQPTKQTHCNQATCSILKSLGAPMGDLTDKNGNALLAKDIAKNLSNSSDYKNVTADEAQLLANNGIPVIGVGNGHVATVRPQGVVADNPSAGKGPLINDIGRAVSVQNQNWAFGKNADVQYYAPR